LKLTECVDATKGPVCVLIRVKAEAEVDRLHLDLVELSRVEEVHCRRSREGWLLTACGGETSDPDPLLRAVADLVDAFGPEAEVVEARRGGVPLVDQHAGYQLSARFKVGGRTMAPAADTIVLDAGHVFGSGAHPSTKLVVQAMEVVADGRATFPATVLDVGTGSGVLGLVAARLGAQKVLGIDICEDAVAVARRNVEANGLTDRVCVVPTPLGEISDRFSLVVANLTVSVLMRLAEGIVGRLAPGGTLIVSGLQGRQGGEVEEHLRRYGLVVVSRFGDGKWRALTLLLPVGV